MRDVGNAASPYAARCGALSSNTIRIEVWLYGPLARHAPRAAGDSHACLTLELPEPATLGALFDLLGLPAEERGLTFVNGRLTAMPGIQPDAPAALQHGDRVGVFHTKSMWPFQYRQGAAVSADLDAALGQRRTPFHSAGRP